MTGPRSTYHAVLGHELHVTEWGDPSAPALVMWHGLARTGRDFDELAEALSDSYLVLCPDTIGRGLSSWSQRPEAEYHPPYYAELALGLLDRYGLETVDWLGTSMGGLIGMQIAAGPQAHRLRRLIINDIGPEVPAPAIERIVTYAGALPDFATVTEAEAWLRTVYTPFGPAPDGFWRRMAETSVRRRGDGRLTLHYDPRIIDMMRGEPGSLTVWDLWDRIATPIHVLRGVSSDILTQDVLERMRASGPRPEVTEFRDCGHAPALAAPQDAGLVRALLA